MALRPQQQLQRGKYTIERELGQGRFGITYLARDRNGNRLVIKTLNDQTLNDPADFERWQDKFVEEAVNLGECKHPHIVEAFKAFREGELWCLPMEYVEGKNLADRAHSILKEKDALRYIQQIGEALMVVHSKDMIHRDVKPDNIIVRSGKPEAVLIDFGLAREFGHDLTQTRGEETEEGFTPPELYLRNGKRGPFTDVYSLAATLYVLLTGQVPKSAFERQHNNAVLVAPQDINGQISARVNQAIVKGMTLNVEDRPKTVREWLKLLGLKSTKGAIDISMLLYRLRKVPRLVWAVVVPVGILIAILSDSANLIDFFKRFQSSSETQTETEPPGQP